MENIKKFENSKFCYAGGWSTFAPLKVACTRKWQTVFFIWVHVWKVRYLLHLWYNFGRIWPSTNPPKSLRKRYIFLRWCCSCFIMNSFLLPWEFHGISMEFVLSSCLCWNAFSRITPCTLWNGDATTYPAAESFYGIRVPPPPAVATT
jgi:hypothetical protein